MVVCLVVVVVVGVALFDRMVPPSSAASTSVSSDLLATEIAAPGAQSSAWYCAGGTSVSGGAPATVLVTNSADSTANGTLTAVSSTGASATQKISVLGHTSTPFLPSEMVPGGWVAVTVEMSSGSVAATESVSGTRGFSEAPCASETSGTWYFSHGSTLGTEQLELSLYNPTATDASVDVSLATSASGVIEPPPYQEVQVPAGTLVVESLQNYAQQDPSTATAVTTLTGSVVATELEMTDQPSTELTLVLGAPSPSTSWTLPSSTVPVGGKVVFHVFNPGNRVADVDVSVKLPQQTAAVHSLFVAPDSSSEVLASQPGFAPPGVPFTTVFTSTNGEGVVVDRQVVAAASASAPQRGTVPAVASGADRWLVPQIVNPVGGPGTVTIEDVSDHPVRVSVQISGSGILQGIPALSMRTLAPGDVLEVGPSPPPPTNVSLVISASGPVTVEADASNVGTPGVVVVPALPVR